MNRMASFRRQAFPAPTRARMATGLLFVACAGPALAGGFQLSETSVGQLGNAYAGAAAVADDDASTVWSNPAGMVRLRSPQFVAAVNLVQPGIRFRNDASAPAAGQATGNTGGDAGSVNVVPNLYFAKPLDSRWSAGIGFNAPWGLVTEYDPGWIGRFQAVKSSIKTYNVNPSLAWKTSDGLSLGLGLNLQRMDADFSNQVNYSGALLGAAAANGIAPGSATFSAIAGATAGLESRVRIKGSDDAAGWNAGLLWEFDEKTRAGLQYRASVKYHLAGTAAFTHPSAMVAGPLGPTVALLSGGVNTQALFDSAVRADVKLPSLVNLSYFKALDDRWDLLADLQWVRWSTIRTLTFVRGNGVVLQSTPENFRNTTRLSLGANYHANDTWTWRAGIALDQSPVRTATRTPRLPDADRTWLSAGARYTVSPRMNVDLGAAYLFVKRATVRDSGSPASIAANALLGGHYDNNSVIVSAQLSYLF